MKLIPTPLKDVVIVEPEKFEDERGFFTTTYSEAVFQDAGIGFKAVEGNVSFNRHRGTLRGMHYQHAPHAQAKLVRCTAGRIFDVVIDLRQDSETYCRWFGLELSSSAHNALFVPEGFAHGFLTLADNSEVFYQMGRPYHPASGTGVRWDDPLFQIAWPEPPTLMNNRDTEWPDFTA